jgi:hypothetical protein
MLARNKSSKIGKAIPNEWSEGVARLLNETYKSQCDQNGRYFDVFGRIYPEELLMIVSYLSEKDEHSAPIACFLSSSAEHMKNVETVQETQKNFIDIAGLIFDEIFNSEDWHEFEPNWQEVTHKNQTYSYKISRENINATIEADRLLGPAFEDVEEEHDQ